MPHDIVGIVIRAVLTLLAESDKRHSSNRELK